MLKARLVAIAAVFCVAGTSMASPVLAKQKKPAKPRRAKLAMSIAYRSFNKFVNSSSAGVVARVTGSTTPRWNSASGDKWTITSRSTIPVQYRDLTLEISEVVFSDGKLVPLGLSTREKVTVRQVTAYGDGIEIEAPGSAVGPADLTTLLTVGTPVLALLEVQAGDWIFQDGHFETHIGFADGLHGVWKINDSLASSAEPARSVATAELKARILEERKAGSDLQRDVGSEVLISPTTSVAPPPTKVFPVPPTSPSSPPETFVERTLHIGKTTAGSTYSLVWGLSPNTAYLQLSSGGRVIDGIGVTPLAKDGSPPDYYPEVSSLVRKIDDDYIFFGLVTPSVRIVNLEDSKGTVVARLTPQSPGGTRLRYVFTILPPTVAGKVSAKSE